MSRKYIEFFLKCIPRFVFPVSTLLFHGCKPEFEVFAPEKESYVVYCILNPAKDTQYVKITRVFQTDGDAVVWASQNDPTVHGLRVTLESIHDTLTATEVNQPSRDDGFFLPSQVLYAVPTRGASKLQSGQVWHLHIRKPADDLFDISSTTQIPGKPEIRDPAGPYILSNGSYTYPGVEFDEEVEVNFDNVGAGGYELRLHIWYYENGELKKAVWGPTKVFTDEEGCSSPHQTELCYSIREYVVPRFMLSLRNRVSGSFEFRDEPKMADNPVNLARAAALEVTAIDPEFTGFLRAEDPGSFGINWLMDKREYSNISGNNYGIFGAIHTDESIIFLGQCTKFLGQFDSYEPGNCYWP